MIQLVNMSYHDGDGMLQMVSILDRSMYLRHLVDVCQDILDKCSQSKNAGISVMCMIACGYYEIWK